MPTGRAVAHCRTTLLQAYFGALRNEYPLYSGVCNPQLVRSASVPTGTVTRVRRGARAQHSRPAELAGRQNRPAAASAARLAHRTPSTALLLAALPLRQQLRVVPAQLALPQVRPRLRAGPQRRMGEWCKWYSWPLLHHARLEGARPVCAGTRLPAPGPRAVPAQPADRPRPHAAVHQVKELAHC